MNCLSLWHRAFLTRIVAFLAFPFALSAGPITLTYETPGTQVLDTWVVSSDNVDRSSLTTLTIGGGREAYLRVHVDKATVGAGMPVNASLVLRQTAGVTGTVPITVHAANNRKAGATADWAESMGWTAKPLYVTGTALSTQNALSAAGFITFNLTDYISGPGDYSFCVRTSSATQVSFSSSETSATNRPKLQVVVYSGDAPDWDSAYYERTPVEMIALGTIFRNRYKASTAGTTASDDVEKVGYFDVTKQPYGADPAGIIDSTLAIQRAVNEARAARVAVYFPPGNYKVSDTIELVQGDNPKTPVNGDVRWSGREFPCVLLGNRDSVNRSTIVLDPANGAEFGTATTPSPVLHFWSREGSSRTSIPPIDPVVNKANNQYNQILDNIDITVSGRPNAVGINMDAAQGSNISNSTITATGGFAGLVGGTGPGGYTYGVTVIGGQFGAYFEDAHCPLIVNSKFTNQASGGHALFHAGRGPLTLVGVEINGRSIQLDGGATAPWQGNLNVIDSRIQISADGANPRLAVESNRSVSLTNVYLLNGGAESAIQIIDPLPPATRETYNYTLLGAGWRRLREFARGVKIDQSPNFDPKETSRVKYWINNVVFDTGAHEVDAGAGAPPSQYSAGNDDNLHAWPATPKFSPTDVVGGVVNAKTTTLVATGSRLKGDGSDDAPRLQAIINAAGNRPIFIPAGEYTLNSTVILKDNTTLFGMGTAFSILRPSSSFAANTPLLTSPASLTATTMLADLKLLMPMNVNGTVSALLWQSGAGSTVKNVDFDRRQSANGADVSLSVPLVTISGVKAGGKWAGVRIIASENFLSSARYLKVDGAAEKLRFYMLNIEHCEGSPQAEFVSSKNFDIYQVKAESYDYNGEQYLPNQEHSKQETFLFNNCTDFRAFGFGGSASPLAAHTNIRISGVSDNYLLTQIQFQQQGKEGDTFADPRLFDRLVVNNVSKVLGETQAVYYRKGTPPDQAN